MTHSRHHQTQSDGRPWGPGLRSEPPDPMLLSQWWASPTRTPVELLMLAVLEDAVNVVQKHYPQAARALAWVDSSDETYVFSFIRICDTLNLPADRIRRRLLGDGPTQRVTRQLPYGRGRVVQRRTWAVTA